jgi:hypothetical protein
MIDSLSLRVEPLRSALGRLASLRSAWTASLYAQA